MIERYQKYTYFYIKEIALAQIQTRNTQRQFLTISSRQLLWLFPSWQLLKLTITFKNQKKKTIDWYCIKKKQNIAPSMPKYCFL